MKIICHSKQGVQIVTISGSLTHIDTQKARDEFEKIITIETAHIVLNLQYLNYIDARGLSVFISAAKRARHYQGGIVLANVPPTIIALIELTRLQHTFCIYHDEAAAIASFQDSTLL